MLDGLVFGVIRGVVSWAVWALIAWIIGTTILKTRDTEADWDNWPGAPGSHKRRDF